MPAQLYLTSGETFGLVEEAEAARETVDQSGEYWCRLEVAAGRHVWVRPQQVAAILETPSRTPQGTFA